MGFPLHEAAKTGDVAAIQQLLGAGAAVDSVATDGWTPLHVAAFYGQADAIRVLVDAGAAVDSMNKDGNTPLHFAADKGHIAAIHALVGAGAAVDSVNKDGSTPLHFAAWVGNGATTQVLVGAKAAVDNVDSQGWTPLHIAAGKGHIDAIRALVGAGAARGSVNMDGDTPLHLATQNGHVDAIRALVGAGAAVASVNKDGDTPLHLAAGKGHLDAIRVLVGAGAAVDSVDSQGVTPLHFAAQRGHVDTIRALLGAGAAVGSVTVHGNTPLHWAAAKGHTDAIRALLGAGAAVGSMNKFGNTPLHWAAFEGHTDAIRALVGVGAAVGSVDSDGWTPLHLAADMGHVDAIQALVGAGAAVGSVKRDGWSPLHLAAWNGHVDATRALVSVGASLACKDKGGRTPLKLALVKNQAAAARVLQEAAREAEAERQRQGAWMLPRCFCGLLGFAKEEQKGRKTETDQKRCETEAPAAAEALLQAAVLEVERRLQNQQQQFKEEAEQHRQQLTAMQEELARLRASSDKAHPDLDSAQERAILGKGRAAAKETAMSTPLSSVASAVPGQPSPVVSGTNVNTPVWSVPPKRPHSPPTPLEAGLPSCEVAESEIELVEKLGQGSFGEVWRGQWFGSDVAVKKLKAEAVGELPAEVLASLRKESALMASLRHDRIVGFRGVCFDPPMIVMELCGRQALDTVLQEARRDRVTAQKLTWPRRLGILVDIAWGMAFLHSRYVLHRDLKSPNVLVDDHWRAKVSDFNLSKLVELGVGSTTASSRARSTYSNINPRWLAPELVLEGEDGSHGHATPSSDCFAFGLVMWEVLTWQYPWANLNDNQVVARLLQGRRPPIPDRSELPGPNSGSWVGLDKYISLLQRCWDNDPAARPNFSSVAAELQGLLG